METVMKKMFSYSFSCLKRGIILAFPMVMVFMLCFEFYWRGEASDDISAQKERSAVMILYAAAGMFYAVCAYCILSSFNKYKWLLLVISAGAIIALVKFNPELARIAQHNKCITVPGTPCPPGIVLGGG